MIAMKLDAESEAMLGDEIEVNERVTSEASGRVNAAGKSLYGAYLIGEGGSTPRSSRMPHGDADFDHQARDDFR
jgi:hypothetical protein